MIKKVKEVIKCLNQDINHTKNYLAKLNVIRGHLKAGDLKNAVKVFDNMTIYDQESMDMDILDYLEALKDGILE